MRTISLENKGFMVWGGFCVLHQVVRVSNVDMPNDFIPLNHKRLSNTQIMVRRAFVLILGIYLVLRKQPGICTTNRCAVILDVGKRMLS